jgi:hypothetical protein
MRVRAASCWRTCDLHNLDREATVVELVDALEQIGAPALLAA